jgi:hypothetical protein
MRIKQAGFGGFQPRRQRRFKRFTIFESAVIDDGGFDTKVGDLVQAACGFIVRQNQTRPRRMVADHAFHQSHHVRAAARDQDGDPCHRRLPE